MDNNQNQQPGTGCATQKADTGLVVAVVGLTIGLICLSLLVDRNRMDIAEMRGQLK